MPSPSGEGGRRPDEVVLPTECLGLSSIMGATSQSRRGAASQSCGLGRQQSAFPVPCLLFPQNRGKVWVILAPSDCRSDQSVVISKLAVHGAVVVHATGLAALIGVAGARAGVARAALRILLVDLGEHVHRGLAEALHGALDLLHVVRLPGSVSCLWNYP